MATAWFEDSFERVLPGQAVSAKRAGAVSGARGTTVAFQVAFRPGRVVRALDVKLDGKLAKRATARLAGLVPLRHHTVETPAGMLEGDAPGFVPDPLIGLEGQSLDAHVTRSIWISVVLPDQAGASELHVIVSLDDQPLPAVTARLQTWPFKLPPLKLPVTNWFYSDALVDWYGMKPFSARYWQLVERYFRNMTAHHQTVIYTPLFTPPLDGQKRDLQLIDVTEIATDRYTFSFARLERWLGLAQSAGFQYFEMSHLFSQWGAAHAIRILARRGNRLAQRGNRLARRGNRLAPLWAKKYGAVGSRYRRFLEQFLPALVRVLKKRKLFDRCIFHLSDEPHAKHLEQYRTIREMVRRIAPELRITEALSDVSFYQSGLINQPVPSIASLTRFVEAGASPWTYYCCNPRGTFPNRFLDYPLYRLRILAAVLMKYEVRGFLHWGLNYWYRSQTTQLVDPFHVNEAHAWPGWTAGDPFIVYPGPDGPIDSIRWEIFRETVDDYRLLKLAASIRGVEHVKMLLNDVKAPDDFPRSAEFQRKLRQRAAKIVLSCR